MNKQRKIILIFLIAIIAVVLIIPIFSNNQNKTALEFDQQLAWQHVLKQMTFGPRTPGSEAHQLEIDYIQEQLQRSGWSIEIQQTERMGHPIKNIIAKRGSGYPWFIFGAHYDSRFYADHDETLENQTLPVPGANDGASGVAVLLEMARVLPKKMDQQVWLVFFDAEDQGRIDGWDWILGSRAMAESLIDQPDAVLVIDMIGDKDLQIYREISSDKELTDSIWRTAAELGYSDYFINEEKYSILDDHLPFLESGIPAVDIIDFDYPVWHTLNDTEDQISADSLKIVGDTLIHWLEQQKIR